MSALYHPLKKTHPAVIIATWFYSGLSPKAPGTMGSLAALPFAFALHYYFGGWAVLAAAILAFAIGWWASAVYMRHTGRQDPGEIVIDEVSAMWLCCAVVDARPVHDWPLLAGCYLVLFALFRLFDITKPPPIRAMDAKWHSAFGVMIDDTMAGFMAICCYILVALLSAALFF